MEEYNVVIVVVIVVVVIIHARHRHLYRIQSRDVSDRGIVLFLSGLVLSCLESGFSFVGMSVSCWSIQGSKISAAKGGLFDELCRVQQKPSILYTYLT